VPTIDLLVADMDVLAHCLEPPVGNAQKLGVALDLVLGDHYEAFLLLHNGYDPQVKVSETKKLPAELAVVAFGMIWYGPQSPQLPMLYGLLEAECLNFLLPQNEQQSVSGPRPVHQTVE